jgi:DNA-binding SARP family transcriptional activator
VSGAAFDIETLARVAAEEYYTETPAQVSKDEERTKSKNPSLVVYALGRFRAYCDDQLITIWRSKKGKAIFKFLLTQRDHRVAKDILMDVFWPDATPEAARNDLNVAIHGLRQAIKTVRPDWPFILYEDEHYVINPAIELWVDFEEYTKRYKVAAKFEREGDMGRALREYERAEGLYLGDFLEEDLYKDWTISQRESLKDTYLVILDFLSRQYLIEKKYAGCIQFCRKMLVKDDCREDAHRRLMVCYILQGERNLALRQYEVCVENLAHALDVSPMEETIALFRRIRNDSIT